MAIPAFLVVGTPRSGTTLVQRLALQLRGVAMPPETHFFTDFTRKLVGPLPRPLDEQTLRDVLEAYAKRPYFAGIDLDVNAVLAQVSTPVDDLTPLFAAVCRVLSPDAAIVGEKTPGHLHWWRPLTRSLPALRVVAVVRDPRAVAVSYAKLGWGGGPALTGLRWRADVDRIVDASRALGERCLVLRFEDVVADEDSTRERLAAFLGTTVDGAATPSLVIAEGQPWMEKAVEPADPTRAEAWRSELDPVDAALVIRLAGPALATFGYPTEGAAPFGAQGTRLVVRRGVNWVRRTRRRREVDSVARRWLPAS